MLCLMKNPRVHKKLVAEIDGALQEGKIPPSETQVISDAQARTLPYLQAVIKEVGPCYDGSEMLSSSIN